MTLVRRDVHHHNIQPSSRSIVECRISGTVSIGRLGEESKSAVRTVRKGRIPSIRIRGIRRGADAVQVPANPAQPVLSIGFRRPNRGRALREIFPDAEVTGIRTIQARAKNGVHTLHAEDRFTVGAAVVILEQVGHIRQERAAGDRNTGWCRGAIER